MEPTEGTEMDMYVETRVTRLSEEYHGALARYRRDETDEAYQAEQAAWDKLVDFVEANDLNYSKWDPRGPEEAQT